MEKLGTAHAETNLVAVLRRNNVDGPPIIPAGVSKATCPTCQQNGLVVKNAGKFGVLYEVDALRGIDVFIASPPW